MDERNDDLSVCPSFNSYSSDRLAAIATTVGDESRPVSSDDQSDAVGCSGDVDAAEDDDDFEFTVADEIYYDGQVRPVFPIFNRDLLMEDYDKCGVISPSDDVPTTRIPLKSLFLQENDAPMLQSCSSSEADELETVPPGTYCVWRPKIVQSSPSQCKKSKSTGSASRRWRLRDLLRRSNSDGKDSFVFLTPKRRDERHEKTGGESSKEKQLPDDGKVAGKSKVTVTGRSEKKPSSSPHEAFYVRNRALKEGDKRKSYLPYRKDLLGFFANVHPIGRTFPPF